MLCASYQEALDEIYRTYMAVKGDVKGKYDRQVRDPVRLVSIASRLGVVPPPEKIIRVTGSKGKGTTSRLIASQLQKTTGRSVGLLVSPEELEHTDRMRVNGCQISKDEFVSLLNELDEVLSVAKQALSPGQYLSPSGLFLLLALVWFRRREVQLFVLETGRGVLFDEVGQIPSAVSVITSILLEHPEYLGPTLSDIARDKLSIAGSSSHVIVPHSVAKLSEGFAAASKNIQIVPPPRARSAIPLTTLPDWLVQDGRLAEAAVSTFLGCSVNKLARITISEASAAFGSGSLGSAAYAFEAIVNLDSLDRELFSAWRSGFRKLLVVTSLPDDKDRERLLDYFQRQDCQIVEVVLDGIRGYLDYDRARKSRASIICDYRNTIEFKEQLAHYLQAEQPDFVYFAGTHTFIRLVKLTLGEFDQDRLASE